MNEIDFLTEARAHVRRCLLDKTIAQLSRESGVEYDWLVKFAADKIKNPGVMQIQKLLAHRCRTAKCDQGEFA